jgi:hypothetical protein
MNTTAQPTFLAGGRGKKRQKIQPVYPVPDRLISGIMFPSTVFKT